MTGAYLLMDGGLLDARPMPDSDDLRREEFLRLMQEAQERRERQQPLIDER